MALTKTFKIELQGTKRLQDDAQSIRKAMLQTIEAIAAAKRELNEALSTKIDSGAVAGLRQQVQAQEVALRELQQQLVAALQQVKAQDSAQQALAQTTNTSTTSVTNFTGAVRTEAATLLAVSGTLDHNLIQHTQLKVQLDAIAREQKELNEAYQGGLLSQEQYITDTARLTREQTALRAAATELLQTIKQQVKENAAVAGSTNQLSARLTLLRQQYRALSEQEKSTDFGRGLLRNIDELDQKLKAEDAALGQFIRKVGDYENSIIRAFKSLGLDDIIKKDIDGAKQSLTELEKKTGDLVLAYRRAQAEGSADLNKLQKEIHDNVVETDRLRQSVLAAETQLRGMGTIGQQATLAIRNSFAEMRGQMAQFLLGYVGFQAAFATAQKTISLNFDFEDTVNQLKAITGVAGQDLEFLKQQALETSSKTKFSAVEILESFKLIASAKPELLENVEALNLIKDAAITLAQASGQTLPEAVDSLTKVLNQFGAGAEQSAEFIDALAAGAKFGAAEIPQVTSALLEFGTQAKTSNVSIQESIGLIELLAEKGIQGAEAGNKLRNVLLTLNAVNALDKGARQELQAAGVDFKKLSDTSLSLETRLKELGKIANNNTALVKVFGKENFNAAQIVLQSIPRYAELTEQIQSTGVAQEQAADQTDSASVRWKTFINQLQNLATSEKVLKFLSGLATVLSFLIGHLGLTIPLVLVMIGLTNTWVGSLLRLTAAYGLQAAAWVVERAQLIANNVVRGIATTLLNIYTVSLIRSATASGVAAVAYRVLAAAIAFLTSPIGIAIGLVVGLTTAFGVMSASAAQAGNATRKLAAEQERSAAAARVSAELAQKVAQATESQVANIRKLTQVVTDETISQETRRKALDELIRISPKYREALQNEAIDIDKVRQVSDELVASLQRQARARGINQLATEKEKEKFALESKIAGSFVDVKDKRGTVVGREVRNKDNSLIGAVKSLFVDNETKQLAEDQRKLNQINRDLENIYEQIRTNKDLQETITEATDEAVKPPVLPDEGKGKGKNLGARLTGQQKDAFKDVEAELARQKAALEKAYLERTEFARLFRELSLQQTADGGSELGTTRLRQSLLIADEKVYLQELLRLNQEAIDKKLSLLRGKNAEERKVMAELQLEKIKNEQDTNKRLLEIDNQQLERSLKLQQQQALLQVESIEQDPNSTNEARIEAREQYFQTLLQSQLVFNEAQQRLEQVYGLRSQQNEQRRVDAVLEIRKKLEEASRSRGEAQLRDIAAAGELQRSQLNTQYAQLRQAILDNDKLTANQRKQQLDRLSKLQTVTILSSELAQLNIETEAKKKLLEQNLISNEEYQKAVEKQAETANRLTQARADADKNDIKLPSTATSQNFIQDQLSHAFGFSSDSAQDKLLGHLISESFSLAKDAMNDFFDQQRRRIEEQKSFQLAYLERERERLRSRATSAAEEDSINRQTEQKRREIEKASAERLKKVKKAELRIALASELANLAVSAATAGASAGPLSPIVIPALYGILSAVALTRYALNLGAINSQQFRLGGALKKFALGGTVSKEEEEENRKRRFAYGGEVPLRGGRFGGRSHEHGGTPFVFGGRQYEAEISELAIVRTKNAPKGKTYRIEGTQSQIASKLNEIGGGRPFDFGAKLTAPTKFATGGQLGGSLQAPQFTASSFTPGGAAAAGGADLEEVKTLIKELALIVHASDSKEVVLNPNEVTKHQDRRRKDVDLATI